MTKVYVVQSGCYEIDPYADDELLRDNQIVEGVFDTEDKAIEWILSQVSIITKQASELGYFTRLIKREDIVESVRVYHTLFGFNNGGEWISYREFNLQ